MVTRQQLHDLIDRLPERDLEGAGRYLQSLAEPGGSISPRLRDAPLDDEPPTPEEDVGAARALAEFERGEYLTAEQFKRGVRFATARHASR